ncbi:hypothetical protein D9M68_860370 [compost metagenome]
MHRSIKNLIKGINRKSARAIELQPAASWNYWRTTLPGIFASKYQTTQRRPQEFTSNQVRRDRKQVELRISN